MKSERVPIDADRLLAACVSELERGRERGVGLQLVCSLLHREVPHFDWVGFYLVVPGERMLVLGPFEGEPTVHVRIPFGRGICGQAAEREETFVVDDVNAAGNYLACSLKVRSEIVVPVMADSGVVAEIDIDSHQRDAFGPDERRLLEALAPLVVDHLPDLAAR